jgi:hypothetical protein
MLGVKHVGMGMGMGDDRSETGGDGGGDCGPASIQITNWNSLKRKEGEGGKERWSPLNFPGMLLRGFILCHVACEWSWHSMTESMSQHFLLPVFQSLDYALDAAGVVRHVSTGEKFKYVDDGHYSAVSCGVTKEIQRLLSEMGVASLGLSTGAGGPHTTIFASADARTNENGLLLLIQGLGRVR